MHNRPSNVLQIDNPMKNWLQSDFIRLSLGNVCSKVVLNTNCEKEAQVNIFWAQDFLMHILMIVATCKLNNPNFV